MGAQSIVTGYIRIWGQQYMEQTRRTIASYPYDPVWPFTNIFWCDSPAQYHGPIVGFVGSYKQVEEAWSEWLWKFSQLLSLLEAMDATVHLDCIKGDYQWRLYPKCFYLRISAMDLDTLIGQQWGIVEAPEEDFSIDPDWLSYVESAIQEKDPETDEWRPYKWDKFVERWPKKPW